MTTKHTFREHILRVVAVIGLIAVLLLGAWGIIQLAFFIPTFLGNIGGSLTAKNEAPKTTATTTVKTAVVTETPKPVVKTPAVKSPASTKYVASPKPRAALYGYSDLQVRIINAPTSVRNGQQVSLQFIIENTGTNAVPANWYFTASLPYSPTYTYQSPVQQALYPGDKIVYTLGYTAQYTSNSNNINPCGGWSYPCTNPTPVYGGPGTCNAYGPCNVPGYSPNVYGYSYPQQNYGGTQSASINADPYNLVWELNESNNTAGISYQVY